MRELRAAERPLVAQLAGRRRPAGTTRRARRRPRRPRRCVHPAGRGDRTGALDRRGGPHRRHDARLVLGSRATAACTRPPRTPRRWWFARRTSPTTPPRRPTRSAAIALFRLAALTGEQRYHHQADRILQLIKGAARRHRRRLLERVAGGRPPPARRHRGGRSSAIGPTWCASPTRSGGPTPCWPGVSRTTHRCGTGVPTVSPTSAATTPARRRRTPSRASPRRSPAAGHGRHRANPAGTGSADGRSTSDPGG